MIYLFIILIPLIGNCDLVAGAINSNDSLSAEDIDEIDLNAQQVAEPPYCFQFTWPGSYGKLESNSTCESVLNGVKGIPCTDPLYMTNNSLSPNTTELWQTNKTDMSCPLRDGDVCVKYSYFYNGAVENITYMCSKVRIENGDPVTSGCFQENNGGRMVEVCACRSLPGSPPCNSADKIVATFLEIVLKVAVLVALLGVVR